MSKDELTFSIIVPALNEEASIRKCLESLKDQDFRGDYEIIVVDNGSTDDTVKIASKFKVRVIKEKEKGQVNALITGCRSAKGIFYVFTDSDTILPSDWLSKIYDDFSLNSGVVAVGGPYVFYDTDEMVNNIVRTIAIPIYQKILFRKFSSIPSANMAVKAPVYKEIGGFNKELGWGFDVELCKRLKQEGRIFFDPTLLVSTSFRRYKGQSENRFEQIAYGIREAAIQIYRLNQVATKSRKFKQQKTIRLQS